MRQAPAPFLLLPALLAFLVPIACRPAPPSPGERPAVTQAIYNDLLVEYGPYYHNDPESSGWKYTYHPMIHAAWVLKGRNRVSGGLETRLRQGHGIYWTLRDDLTTQAEEGAVRLDRDRFLALIPDEELRAETDRLMDEGVLALYAFCRTWMSPVMADHPDVPEQILTLLGKAFTDRPDICEVPVGEQDEDEDTRWRDWLHHALAACGERGVRVVLDFDDQIEALQHLVPEDDFWKGRLSIAYSLRSVQLARAEALNMQLEALAPYRTGGQVSDLHKWMYWNVAWTKSAGGAMFPYSDEDITRIDEFLQSGLVNGPLGKGKEARVIADSLGRSPSMDEANRFFDMIENPDLPCERRQLGYMGLARMFVLPIASWETDPAARDRLRDRAVATLERGALPCGNGPLLDLYEAVLSGFDWSNRTAEPGARLTDLEMQRIHNVFMILLHSLTTADERAAALDLISWGLMQPDFMAAHPELSRYRDSLLAIHEEWLQTTRFEDSEITEEDFEWRLVGFRESLGGESPWVNE